jgi:hypothetical protein
MEFILYLDNFALGIVGNWFSSVITFIYMGISSSEQTTANPSVALKIISTVDIGNLAI